MSWLRLEGRMPVHRKVAPLSDAAFRMHVTAMAWSVEERSDGHVPSNIPKTLTGAPRSPKALKAVLDELVDAELWERTDEGFLVHDFLNYNPSAAQCEARRQAAAIAGSAGGKAKAARGHGGTLAHGQRDAGEDQADSQLATSEPLASRQPTAKRKPGVGLPTRVGSPDSDPDPHQTATPTPPAPPDPPGGRGRSGDVPCPPDLALSPDQRGSLETSMIPGWAIDAVTVTFRAQWVGSTGSERSLDQWRRSLVKAVTAAWNDPRQRPKRPEPDAPPAKLDRPLTFDEVCT